MKREGYQHGMVRTHRILPNPLNPRPETRHVNQFNSLPTAGSFTRVPTKPTNHSKFTGKCGLARCNTCHLSPAHNAKLKTKGHQKAISTDVASNHRLLTWRVVDPRPGLVLSRHSASGILDLLAFDHHELYDDDDEYDEEYPTVDIANNDDDIEKLQISSVDVEEYESWCLV